MVSTNKCMNSNIASSFCNMNKKKESNMLQTTIYLADLIPRQSQRAINLSLVFQLKFNSKVKEVEEDLLHHCRPQPRKTETHSACKQFCSCDAQQKNTVVIYHRAKSSNKIIFNTIAVRLIVESNTRNQKKGPVVRCGQGICEQFRPQGRDVLREWAIRSTGQDESALVCSPSIWIWSPSFVQPLFLHKYITTTTN